MAKDSEIWKNAYNTHQVMKLENKQTKAKLTKEEHQFNKQEFRRQWVSRLGDESLVLQLNEIDRDIEILKNKKYVLYKKLKEGKTRNPSSSKQLRQLQKREELAKTTYSIYVLKLQGGYIYVGITKNVDQRFKRHIKGKGSNWTKLHPPIDLIETRPTPHLIDSHAAQMENEVTLEYAKKYGTDLVRGGGYCQTKPVWPPELFEHV